MSAPAMTPADELMALAVAWESDAVFDAQHGQIASAATFEQCAADLRALLDSDAFRAMARDAERWQFVRRNLLWSKGYDGRILWRLELVMPEPGNDAAPDLDAAIDAAAIGAGEE